ncbi:mechanosensitive ion channel family protein [Sphingobacterium humi]|uniref:Mechanosensitive ion channel n=1 Tax=Sphingobacterium humi TaxID=1796905 RepID=A0A6N8L1U5_9SPHI|nr:mechanosensitive ion channel family protein [Sphingobacterium humi]MVZ63277.1 mechanosensitive ion channel [Sphingobacterium humi]
MLFYYLLVFLHLHTFFFTALNIQESPSSNLAASIVSPAAVPTQTSEKIGDAEPNDSVKLGKPASGTAEVRLLPTSYAVRLNQDSLFAIYTKVGSFLPKERAAAISEKIKQLYQATHFEPEQLQIQQQSDTEDIVYAGEEVIISISNLDASMLGYSKEELASNYLSIIKESILKERENHSWLTLLKRLGLSTLVLLTTALLIYSIHRLFQYLAHNISANKQRYGNIGLLKRLKIVKPEHIENIFLRINGLLKIIFIGLSIYLTIPLLFSLFPETEAWTGTLIDWVLSPIKSMVWAAIAYLPNLIRILLIFILFKYGIHLIRYVFLEMERGHIHLKGFHADWALPTFNILRFMLYAFMLVLIFPFLPGSSSPAFQGVTVFLGVLVSLGSSNAIANIVAGLVITYMRPFRIGDRVKIGDSVGDVMEKSMLVTRIKTIKNEDITVPNSMILSSTTVNYSNHTKNDGKGLIVHYTLSLDYEVPWEKVYPLLIEAALHTPYIQQEPKPFVLQTQLNDFNISYQINAYTKEANAQAMIYSKLLENIRYVFQREEIELLSPEFHVLK